MTTSEKPFPKSLTAVDELSRPDHSHLHPDDNCLFFGEYTARKGWSFSATNQLISNFKIGLEHRTAYRWRYKQQAIKSVAEGFGEALNPKWLEIATLVPVPPSKCRAHPLYDDRIARMLEAIPSAVKLDIRELILQVDEREAAHDAECRPRPDDHLRNYRINEALTKPKPTQIGIFDDMLVTGSSFKACQQLLAGRFPGAPICGLFIARRVPEAMDFDKFLAIFE